MKLLKYIGLIIFIFLLNCNPVVNRGFYNYSLNDSTDDSIEIITLAAPSDKMLKFALVGKVRISDNGFSTNCDSTDIFKILRDEATKLGADVINLVEVKKPIFGAHVTGSRQISISHRIRPANWSF